MKLRPLTIREKNYGVFVCVACCMVVGWGVESRLKRQMNRAGDELAASEDKLAQTKNMLEMAMAESLARRPKAVEGAPVQAVFVDKKESLHVLRDLTIPEMSGRVNILSAEKSGSGFAVTLTAEFSELMAYISFLERQEAKFTVSSAVLSREASAEDTVQKKAGGGPDRLITAIVQLNSKG